MSSTSKTEKTEEHAICEHMLQRRWTFWYNNGDVTKSWGERFQNIYTFGSIERFWDLMNSIVQPSRLGEREIYVFEESDSYPCYENYKDGGVWSVNYPRRRITDTVDDAWLGVLLSLIGETFNDHHRETKIGDIAGVVFSIKRATWRIQVWTKTASDTELQMRIGQRFRLILDLDPRFPIKFVPNSASLSSTAMKFKRDGAILEA